MNYSMHLLLALTSGFAIGIFYFSSLWVTVRQLPTTQQPILLIIGSLLGRLSITILGFYLIMDGSWQLLLIALFGFVLARSILIRRWKPRTFFR
ncbi:ATP synthase subunit I [Rivularia sp. UHCC 0363]|uniref:ATP synthase subunit I n=1 Tax=Rivularia sp. UHCC 0363 TaxID=3110244 RepID=UPI002B1FE67E|nr:ATP synthase subunit I [Rivularia sp. UHCC 0363]MEA5594036.1 ATP synthase subunit I [Rivularia sp. UHCC 0363]